MTASVSYHAINTDEGRQAVEEMALDNFSKRLGINGQHGG